MPREKRETTRVSGDIPDEIVKEWEDAMMVHYDVFVRMLSRGQRLELAIVAHTRLMQAGGGNILPPRTVPRKPAQSEESEGEDGPERWHSEENGQDIPGKWQDYLKRA